MKRINYTIGLVALNFMLSAVTFGQQEYQFANTVNNPYLLNPAAGGMTDVMQFEASTRMQWLGYDGGPKTILLSGHSQIKFGKSGENTLDEFNIRDEKLFQGPAVTTSKSKHVIGGKVWNDAIGPFSKTAIQGSYAYHLPLTKYINVGVGLVVYSEKFFFGLSTTQFLKNKVELNQISTASNFNRHYFMIAKYKIEGEGDISIEPNVIVKMVQNSPVSVDFGARALYKNSSWFGVQFRTSSSLVFQVGSNLIKNLYVSYAYEASMGKLRTAGNSTHEIQLGYYLGRNRNVDKELKENSEKL